MFCLLALYGGEAFQGTEHCWRHLSLFHPECGNTPKTALHCTDGHNIKLLASRLKQKVRVTQCSLLNAANEVILTCASCLGLLVWLWWRWPFPSGWRACWQWCPSCGTFLLKPCICRAGWGRGERPERMCGSVDKQEASHWNEKSTSKHVNDNMAQCVKDWKRATRFPNPVD